MRITIHSFMQKAARSKIGDLHSKFPKSKALTSYGTYIRKRKLHKLSFCCIMVLYMCFRKSCWSQDKKVIEVGGPARFCDIADMMTWTVFTAYKNVRRDSKDTRWYRLTRLRSESTPSWRFLIDVTKPKCTTRDGCRGKTVFAAPPPPH
jgi:hypothetical protein